MSKTCQNFTMRNQKRFLLRHSGFFILNSEHIYNWLAASTSDNDQVKVPGKDRHVIY